ncbi:unnamed protein product [Chrysodeixis includens]|uniref:Uncharacterized protein n=1 Tax=Chrysodeixis includens TaxID=689277 RepID=A0A9P0BVG5_CHRIL|nr:unnamed protein product [Chrysodeixis includens]
MAPGKHDWKTLFIDYDVAKQRYLKAVKDHHINTGLISTNAGIQRVIKDIENKVIKTEHFVVKLRRRRKYLYQKRRTRFFRILSDEETFDTVLKHHFGLKHQHERLTISIVRKYYSVSQRNIRAALNACTRCYPQPPPPDTRIKLPGGRTWRLNIVPFAINVLPDVSNYLLVYKENMTNFVILRPIPIEFEGMVVTLLKICLEFGPPNVVLVSEKLDFYKDLLQKPVTIGFSPKITVRLIPADIIANDTAEVEAELTKWCEENENKDWDIGCHIVQLKMNTTKKKIIRFGKPTQELEIPYNLMFRGEANNML